MKKSRDTNKNSRNTFICATLLVASVVAYVYYLNVSVVHVVMRQEITQDINHLHTEIATLETAFIEAQHTVASRIATLEGYSTDSAKIFITRGETSLVLRDN